MQQNLKKCCTVIKIQGFHDVRLKPSKEAQKAPKTTPGASPGTPTAAQEAPRATPESPKSAPGEAQEPPGATPKSFQTRLGRRMGRQRSPRGLLEAILEPPGPHLGGF